MAELILSPDVIAAMSDHDLLFTYQRTSGEPGEAEAEALLAEIVRRNLNI